MAVRERDEDVAVPAEARGASALAIVNSPVWEETAPLTLERWREMFDHAQSFTVGVEEELMLVDQGSLELAPAIDEVLPLLAGARSFSKELRAAQIEIVTPVCETAAEACRALGSSRRRLLEALP